MTIEKNNIKTENIIDESYKEKLLKEKNTYVAARTSKLPEGMATAIVQRLQEQFKLKEYKDALTVIAVLFQQGGTARSCDGNMSTIIFSQEFKLADIRKILKQMSCNKAERKLARTLATSIQQIAYVMEIPGNLYSKIQKSDLNRTFTTEEKSWLSDFQSDNENCPVELRTLIIDTFKKNKENKKKPLSNITKN
jgi:hypothetical protein